MVTNLAEEKVLEALKCIAIELEIEKETTLKSLHSMMSEPTLVRVLAQRCDYIV